MTASTSRGATLVHLDREGGRGFAHATGRIGRDLGMQAGVEQDATIRMLDEVEEVRAVDLGADALVERIERRDVRPVTAAETGEDPHPFPVWMMLPHAVTGRPPICRSRLRGWHR
jgi:hypothetical protein